MQALIIGHFIRADVLPWCLYALGVWGVCTPVAMGNTNNFILYALGVWGVCTPCMLGAPCCMPCMPSAFGGYAHQIPVPVG